MPAKIIKTLSLITAAIPAIIWGSFHFSSSTNNHRSLLPLLKEDISPAKLDTEENRFTKTVMIEKMDEPLQMAILDANKVLYIERKGKIWLYDHLTKKPIVIATIPVSTKYTDKQGKKSEAEDGLLGIALDPGYATNKWIYLYYSPAGNESKNILARYEFRQNKLITTSKKVVLEVPVQREECCHTGGSIAFDATGNLYLSTGDNTSPRATAYAPIDERKGRSPWDAQKSSANTNDLRGKIIRIRPLTDGTYAIPEGNLFPKGTTGARPEIYAMGTRNPYRISVDRKTGYLYWGDVGPDSGKDSVGHGPKSFDEINQARKPGYFGWPYFVGNNQPYWKYDFASNTSGDKFNPDKPLNTSPNNTGMQELPPTQKPLIWYSYDPSREFPMLGTGGRSAMAGPVYYTDEFKTAKRKFPDYYDGKLFIYDWMRDWVMTVTMTADGNYKSMQRFLPNMGFSHPIDMQFGPDGDLYVIEYGTGWFQGNDDARLVRIEYNGGNRKPITKVDADKKEGALPMLVQFSSAGTKDDDKDSISYDWKITNATGAVIKTFSEANPSFEFKKAGVYNAVLTTTDANGAKSSAKLQVRAGNDAPNIDIDITKGNSAYFFAGQPIEYNVKVHDKEDGELGKGILKSNVNVDIRYVNDGSIPVASASAATVPSTFAEGQRLIGQSDCKSCHAPNKKLIGPAYVSIAQKYKSHKTAVTKLTDKVINGGNGVWGEVPMAPHPQLARKDVTEMIKYIMSLGSPQTKTTSLPLTGSYSPKLPDTVGDKSLVIVTAKYTDKGAPGAKPVTTEKKLILKNPKLSPATSWKVSGTQKFKLPDPPMDMFIAMSNNNWAAYNEVDLTGIHSITFNCAAPKEQLASNGGFIEVRLDSPTGELVGTSNKILPFDGPITNLKPENLAAEIKPVTGKHDLYFIFKNDEAKGALFIVFSATLANK